MNMSDTATTSEVKTVRPSEEFVQKISHEYARRHLVLSAGTEDGVELLVVAESTLPQVAFNVGVRLGRKTAVSVTAADVLASAIDRAYASLERQSDEDGAATEVMASANLEQDLASAVRNADADLLNTGDKNHVVRLVDLLLFEAVQRKASDVHIQPLRERVLVRYRIDGVLLTVRELPVSLASAVISRVKIMARLDIAEQRAAQDGRATVTIGGSVASRGCEARHRVDLRIASLPTTYGERIVIRLLDTDRSSYLLNFKSLGMPEDVQRRFLGQVSRTSGIVLVTGPTGSGKTTTLYTTLSWITSNASPVVMGGTGSNGCELNIMTIEDPVEYDLSTAGLAISQTQLNAKKGVTFAAGLRHILRQDPDVIMVGEIRDEETARIAVQASLTGHLVLSTLHTIDATSAVARLLDLGVEPFLVSSSLAAVLAQRLLRTFHSACGGAGCEECFKTGFSGRTGVFELLVLDEAMRTEVNRRSPTSAIAALARNNGMVTLLEAGQALVTRGLTNTAEVARVIAGIDEETMEVSV